MKKIALLEALSLSMLGGCDSSVHNVADKTPELPVSRVVMYQSGIGYIERTANIDGNEFVLRIRPDQINDILKSLTVIDRGDGRPVSISLPVDKTTLDRLAQIPEQIHEGGLKEMLRAFRGANVKIRTKNGSFEGRVIGIEENTNNPYGDSININTNQTHSALLTLFTKNNAVNVIAIDDIKSVELFDKALSDGVTKSLNISLNEGSWKQVELRIRMDSSKKRDLALSYLIAMPTWKPAYRLILDDDETGTIQGWAIISNVTGSDWNNIHFSLVSGQPMSFTYDLYTPQFLDRPDLTGQSRTKALAPEVTTSTQAVKPSPSLRPEVPADYALADEMAGGFGGGFAAAETAARMPAPSKAASRARKSAQAAKGGAGLLGANAAFDSMMAAADFDSFDEEAEAMPEAAVIDDSELIANFQDMTSTSQVGSFEVYNIDTGLTIPDAITALVNLVQSSLSARDTRLFKEVPYINFDQIPLNWESKQSFQTVELKNTSKIALDEGPITIYRDSAVIGEGYLSHTAKGATAYITFAAEEGVSCKVTESNTTSEWQLDAIKNGRCQYTEIKTHRNTFTFDSHLDKSTTAILPIKRGYSWEPVESSEQSANIVTNDKSYMISVAVPAGEKAAQAITMQQKLKRSDSLSANPCTKAIEAAIQNNSFTPELAEDLKKLTESQKRLSDLNTRYSQLNAQARDLNRDQNSISDSLYGLKNIKTANANKLRNQLIERQSNNSKRLEEIMTETYEIMVEKSELEMTIKELTRTLDYYRES